MPHLTALYLDTMDHPTDADLEEIERESEPKPSREPSDIAILVGA
jgi:hypothetical protein